MKKLLAICLSVFMVISLMPAVFAEDPAPVAISATGETWIEAEDYTTIKISSDGSSYSDYDASSKVVEGTFNGGKAMKAVMSTNTAKVEIPISVATPGKYKVTLNAPCISTQYAKVYVDGVAKMMALMNSTDTTQAFSSCIALVDLTADSETLKFEVTKKTGASYVYFYWDYIKLEPAPATATVTGNTRIEAENYPIMVTSNQSAPDFTEELANNMVATGDPATLGKSGGASTARGITQTGAGHNSYIEIPFTAPQDGLYTFKTLLFHYYSGSTYVCDYDIYIDGTKRLDVPQKASPQGWEEASLTAFVPAGERTIKILSSSHSGKYYHLAIDYVDIAPYVNPSVEVPESGALTVQAESYPYTTCVHSDTSTHFVVGTVADGIVTSNCTTHTDANGKNNWNITLNVAATGIYEIKTVAGGALTDANGGAEIKLDGEAIITDTVAGALTAVETFTKRVYLTAGEHTYSYIAKSISGKATATIKHVEITPIVHDPENPADPDTTGTPEISFPAGILTGATAEVKYTYAETNKNPEGNSILRLIYKDGSDWKVGPTTTVTGGIGSIELPDNLAGKEVAIEFIPVDETGKMGPLTTTGSAGTLARTVEISPATITPSGSNFGATVTITNNSAEMGPKNICVILVQYDADGAMLAVTNATVSVENGTPQTLTPSFAKETGAAKVQMFIWDGTGYSDAGASTYRETVTYMLP